MRIIKNKLRQIVKTKLKDYGLLIETLGKSELSRLSWLTLDHDLSVVIGEKNPIIFDIGANSGQSVQKFKSIFPHSTIYSFEPLEEYHTRLKEISLKYDEVYCEQLAVGAKEELVIINRNQKAVLSSILDISNNSTNRFANKKTVAQYEVKQITVDSYVTLKAIKHIDLLKIDVQGYDLEVLKGSANALNNNVDYILIELNMIKMYERQPSYTEILTFLDHYNFQLVNFYEISRSKLEGRQGTIDWCTALFKKTDL